jgi:hypothetical protein
MKTQKFFAVWSLVILTMLCFVHAGIPVAQAATITVIVRGQDALGTKVGRPKDIDRRSNGVWVYVDSTDQYDQQPSNMGRVMQVTSAGVLTVIANIGEVADCIHLGDSSTSFVMGRSGTLYRVSLTTGAVTTVAVGVTTPGFSSTLTGRQISSGVWELYVGDRNLARIMKVNSGTGAVSVLFDGMVTYGMTMDGSDIMAVESYFGVGYLGRISSVTGLQVGGWVTFPVFSPRSLARRTGSRYWVINSLDNGLYEINTSGGSPILLQPTIGGFVSNINENLNSSTLVACDSTTRAIALVSGL